MTFDLGLHPAIQITWIARQAKRLCLLFVRNFMNVFIANPALQWSDFVTLRLMRPKPLYYRTDNDMLSVMETAASGAALMRSSPSANRTD